MLHVTRFGNGPRALLAFHGIGQDGACFAPVSLRPNSSFTVYAFDLPFHGQTPWAFDAANPISKTDWKLLINRFLAENNIEQFSVAGFSMGGKFALVTAELFAERIDELWLLAPDGITLSFWYWLATNTAAGRWLYRLFVVRVRLLSRVGRPLVQLGFINRSLLRFAESTLATREQRLRVYRSWVMFRKINPTLNIVAEALNHNSVKIRVFLGAFDRVLPAHYIEPLTQKLHHFELTVLKTGHNHLVENVPF
jgi:pimeloyl-ACP methyl ester carboxylesterase